MDDRLFVVILEFCRIELALLRFQDVLGKFQHVRYELHVRDVVKIFFHVPNLVGIAQGGSL